MASGLSDSSGTRKGDRHGASNLDNYLWQHERRLDNYVGFVEHHTFSYQIFPKDKHSSILRLEMIIYCTNNITLSVTKQAEVWGRKRKLAKTIKYSYCAYKATGPILRYDNAHKHPGHLTEHHKHIFNGTGHEITDSPYHIGKEGWPNLHEVIEELIRISVS